MLERDRDRMCVSKREFVCLTKNVCVCVCVNVRERMRLYIVCVCECVIDREERKAVSFLCPLLFFQLLIFHYYKLHIFIETLKRS
jgi:hypothetical protein